MDKNLPAASAGDVGLVLVHEKIPYIMEQPSPCVAATEVCVPEPVLCNRETYSEEAIHHKKWLLLHCNKRMPKYAGEEET